MVVIRLSRRGAKNRPFYDIVVTDSRKPRDSGYIECIGHFNPLARGGEVPLTIKNDRVGYWLQQGGKPSDKVATLIKQFKGQNTPAA